MKNDFTQKESLNCRKIKTYCLTLSQVFPTTHPRKGEPTYFKEQVLNAVFRNNGWDVNSVYPDKGLKLHTIRGNYPLWRERFDQIARGEACLSIRQWTGRPYASKQVEIARLTKEDGIGLQRLYFSLDKDGRRAWWNLKIDGDYIDMHKIAANDGLLYSDWKDWFRGYDLSKSLAVIQFTKFRY